jgi:hypothetical protein
VALDRHQVDLSIKKPIYDPAMARMKRLQKEEREKHGVKRTNLSDIGREAIMRYRKGDGSDYEPRIVRSAKGQKPKREPFRFDVATSEYNRQRKLITADGHRVTQVVEEALKRFTTTGELPWSGDE